MSCLESEGGTNAASWHAAFACDDALPSTVASPFDEHRTPLTTFDARGLDHPPLLARRLLGRRLLGRVLAVSHAASLFCVTAAPPLRTRTLSHLASV